MKMEAFLVCYRHYPIVEIANVVITEDEALKALKEHPKWQEGRFENRGPWGYKHCIHSFWDTAFTLEYPVFEIHRMTDEH